LEEIRLRKRADGEDHGEQETLKALYMKM